MRRRETSSASFYDEYVFVLLVILSMKMPFAKLLLAVGLIQIAAYWFCGAMSTSAGTMALPQPDSPLYYQAARRIVEGNPFSYSEGSSVCTGTTTVLYPFLLAVPYALGCVGDTIIVAGFFLNAFFYLIFLLSWAKAIDGWCYKNNVKVLASLIIAFSGHCAFATFSQTDIGFWLAFSGLFAMALSQRRNLPIGILLALAAWVRPEGIILVVAFAMMTMVLHLFRNDVKTRSRILIVAFGALSACGVFALNYLITGHAQFSSIVGKGHLATLPFASAVISSIADLFSIVKCVILGLSSDMPRELLNLPLFGAFFLAVGVVAFRWDRDNIFGILVLVLATVGGVLNIAMSGMQGWGMDRYLVWIIPICAIFTAEGTCWVEDRLPRHISKIPSVLIVSMSAIGCFGCQCYFSQVCSRVDSERLFAKDCETIMPKGVSVGGFPCAPAYFFSPRRFAHLTGIYSPEFVPQDITENIERLRNKPESRFEYWITCADLVSILGTSCVDKLGEVMLPGPNGMTLMKADWRAFDSILPNTLDNSLNLVAKVDVGYAVDESAVEYNVITRWGYPVFDPFVQFGKLGEREIVDVGRVILGGDEMTVPLNPGRDVTVVIRMWPKHSVFRPFSTTSDRIDCAFSNPLKFNVSVDGNIVDMAVLSYAANGFSDVAFKIPGTTIKNPVTRIGFLGDHITFGYWFYQ